ncbi:hypothetical protein FHQ18_09335 [Deferribacter autotrophicus]|uniref:Uncharacterized protein n=1 Tax=Deferribacter autotrophicus TaxID=500465 RepID=A0A5A8F283_9BACT|nr:hypothetical protein [Deferribacter autotrophicus]KAA0257535.1 hypothetical protein FHQ18_09335 [Deferribacter autotrophicus]
MSKAKNGTIEIIPNTPITRKLASEVIRADSILRSVNNRLMAGHLDYETHQKIISEYQDIVGKITAMNSELTKKLFSRGKKEKEKTVKADDEPKVEKAVVV